MGFPKLLFRLPRGKPAWPKSREPRVGHPLLYAEVESTGKLASDSDTSGPVCESTTGVGMWGRLTKRD